MSIELIEDPQTAPAAVLHTITIPAIGAPWPGQGGVYSGIVRNATGAHHLIVSTDPAGALEDKTWGKYGQDVPGATSKSDGAANTRAMAEAGSETAKEVLALQIDGYADWFIPSQADMHVAFANCAELFEQADYYWTSTQVSRHSAFVQDFELGGSTWGGKDDELRVRAFRTIQLQPFTA